MTELLQDPAVAREWPCAEIHKTPSHVVIDVETPAFGPEDLEVDVEGHTLVVLGKPEQAHEGSAFSFTFQLPPETILDGLHATFLDGVLTVKGPLLRHDGKRKLEIQKPHLVNPNVTGL